MHACISQHLVVLEHTNS